MEQYWRPLRKDESLQFATNWMELQNVTLTEVNQKEKENTR